VFRLAFSSTKKLNGAVAVLLLFGTQTVQAAPLKFVLTFDGVVSKAPFTGRVFVFLMSSEPSGPPRGANWFKPEPIFARDVKDWKPGETLVLDETALAYPVPLAKLPKGAYWISAVMDFDKGERNFSAAAGNGYSKARHLTIDPAAGGAIDLKINQLVQPRRFVETDRVKLVDMESRLLSEFHGRPVHMRAGIFLPKSFAANPRKHYPVIYDIPGFGGDHFMAERMVERGVTDVAGTEMLYVVLDPSCRLGHHVFADSDNNGPCGRALIEELIPRIEKRFRGLGTSGSRFLTGHSSGGWSSLWLQVAYPDFFGGVWSTSPDPVDFRDFQRLDLYKPGANLFSDPSGKPRPLARRNGKPVIFFKPFSDMEDIMAHGGQLGSFEAVFSQRGSDGQPKLLWNRTTGSIDAAVAKSWEKYDIRLVLERNWKMLAPKLAGKLHVYTGGEDTFYLEGPVALLKDALAKLGSDAVIEIVPGRDHGTLRDDAMRKRIAREMAETFRRTH
jgi:hypothetical protein